MKSIQGLVWVQRSITKLSPPFCEFLNTLIGSHWHVQKLSTAEPLFLLKKTRLRVIYISHLNTGGVLWSSKRSYNISRFIKHSNFYQLAHLTLTKKSGIGFCFVNKTDKKRNRKKDGMKIKVIVDKQIKSYIYNTNPRLFLSAEVSNQHWQTVDLGFQNPR